MAVDIFLVIPPAPTNPAISAEPILDQYFKSAFPKAAVAEIRGYSLSAENPTTIGSSTGGAAAGKIRLNPLIIEKTVDSLSPFLYSLAGTGRSLSAVQVYVRKVGGVAGTANKPFLAYEFQMVFAVNLQWSAREGDELPVEHLTLAYGSMAVGYYQQKADGTFGTATKLGWNQVTNTPTGGEILSTF